MRLTTKDIAQLQCCERIGFENAKRFVATGVSLDSRTLRMGDIFIALRGDRFDGHDFVSTAQAHGAVAIIVERHWAASNRAMLASINVPALVVEDTVKALGELARVYRRKFSIPVLLVAGSNGKTTTKDLIASVLRSHYRVLATEENFNNHIGVPKTLFQLQSRHDYAVLEAGTNHPGELAYLCSIAEPTHGLLTNIGNEHLEFFGSLEGVANAEGELFAYLRRHNGTAFVNADDSFVRKLAKGVRKTIRYGFAGRQVAVRGRKLRLQESGCAEFSVVHGKKKEFVVRVGIPGAHNAYNALAAVTVGLTFRVPVTKVQQAIASAPAPSKRMEIHRIADLIVINDTYNANPDSVRAALQTLAEMKIAGRRIAVLADMLELGEAAETHHRKIGEALNQYSVDIVFTYGTAARFFGETARVSLKQHFSEKKELLKALTDTIKPGDGILVKGSRGMKMEEVVTHILEQFSHSMDA